MGPVATRKKKSARKARDPFPEDALTDLARRLRDGPLPIVVLRGEERYFRDRGVKLALDAARAAGMEICRHDALDPEYDASRLLDDLATGALFQSARCVVLHGADKVVVERAKHHSAPVRSAMLARLTSGAEGMLVLSAEKLRADHPLAKEAKERGLVVGCRRLYDSPPAWDPDPRKAELVQWCAARAKVMDVPLDLAEAAYVVAATGNDLDALEDQLARLVGRGREGIAELVAWDASASPWEVAEQLVCGDLKRAVVGIETLFNGGASQRDGSRTIDTPAIVAQLSTAISSKLREAARAADAVLAGESPARAQAAAGVKGPPAAQAAFRRRMSCRPPEQWRSMVEQLGDLERRSRSSVRVDATDFVHLAMAWRPRGNIRR